MVRAALIIIGSTLLIFLGVVAGLIVLSPISDLLIYGSLMLSPFIAAVLTAMIMGATEGKIYQKICRERGLSTWPINKEAREEADRKEKRITILIGVSIWILLIIVVFILAV